MRINPIYQKELKTSVRTIKTAFILFGYNGLLALFGLFAFFVTFHFDVKSSGIVQYADILQIYAIIGATEFGLMLFIIPAMTSAAVAGEREKQTLEILLTTKSTPMQIITGKLMSSISFMVLLAFSSLPILGLVFSIGGITFVDLLEFMILIVVTAVYIGSIGLFFSALLKKTTFATVSTYGVILFLIIGTIALLWGIKMIAEINMPRNELNYYDYVDLGKGILILIINPAMTCFAMIESQIGTGSRFTQFISEFGSVSVSIIHNWFLISIIMQLIISVILIVISARLLDPLRKRNMKRMKTGYKKGHKQ